ncbi:MAG: stage II sporulation protein E [Anaerotignum sp.]|nr:stage II sporulation protein E [Anaerotignum sp.]
MEKTEITLEYTEERPAFGRAIRPQKEQPKPFPWKAVRQTIGFCLMGYFWGRVEMLQILHPMGLAYLSAFFGEGWLFFPVWLMTGIGMLSHVPLKAGAGMAAALAIQMTLGRFVEREGFWKKALLGSFAMALAGVFYAISRQGLGFYFAVAVMESSLVFLISFLLQKGLSELLEGQRYFILTREETISFVLLSGGVLAGVASLEQTGIRQAFLPMAASFCLLLAARQEGIGGGAAAGVFLGFLLFLCGGIDMPLFIALSLGGMLAGCFREFGRFFSALAMVLSPCVFLFYIDAEKLQFFWMGGLLAGAVIFCLFPRSILEKISGARATESPADRYTKIKEMTEERLLGCSAAFSALAKTFRKQEKGMEKKELSRLVDTIAGKVCQGCGLAHYCWEEELYRTYSMTFSALSDCEEKGRLQKSDLPPYFQETCPRLQNFTDMVNEAYEMYRRDQMWGSRMQECRELVGQQMQAVGEIMESLSGQMEPNCIFLEGAAERLTVLLKKQELHPQKVLVTEEKKGQGRQVRLMLPACGGKGVCRDKILPLIKQVLECPMVLREEGTCKVDYEGRQCSLHFQEMPAFAIHTATAFAPAEEGRPTGDAAAFLETEKGHALLALSDGMGMGTEAAQESRTAIELLEQFTEAGFDRELSVKMINSALLLRRGEETYATLDICEIDLYSGHAEFVKLGAAASYLWRNGRVISLRSTTLPAGILKQVIPETNEMLLKDGDMIFMVTDGITDALGGEEETARWMKGKLLAFPVSNPEDAAEYLLQEAKKERRDERRDDMTVLAGRFWKKRA